MASELKMVLLLFSFSFTLMYKKVDNWTSNIVILVQPNYCLGHDMISKNHPSGWCRYEVYNRKVVDGQPWLLSAIVFLEYYS